MVTRQDGKSEHSKPDEERKWQEPYHSGALKMMEVGLIPRTRCITEARCSLSSPSILPLLGQCSKPYQQVHMLTFPPSWHFNQPLSSKHHVTKMSVSRIYLSLSLLFLHIVHAQDNPPTPPVSIAPQTSLQTGSPLQTAYLSVNGLTANSVTTTVVSGTTTGQSH